MLSFTLVSNIPKKTNIGTYLALVTICTKSCNQHPNRRSALDHALFFEIRIEQCFLECIELTLWVLRRGQQAFIKVTQPISRVYDIKGGEHAPLTGIRVCSWYSFLNFSLAYAEATATQSTNIPKYHTSEKRVTELEPI